LPTVLADKVEAFSDAQEGDPTAASGLFSRMLYFSASTVTTLGIGDIQPVSELARTLVVGEAIVGLIFIGLFLDALATRARGDPQAGIS
jgi:Ion channel